MADILEALNFKVDANWKHFGTHLYVDPSLIEDIDKNNASTTDCMLDLVTKWVTLRDRTGDRPRTWEAVVKGVRHTPGCEQLAKELAETHAVTLTWQ